MINVRTINQYVIIVVTYIQPTTEIHGCKKMQKLIYQFFLSSQKRDNKHMIVGNTSTEQKAYTQTVTGKPELVNN